MAVCGLSLCLELEVFFRTPARCLASASAPRGGLCHCLTAAPRSAPSSTMLRCIPVMPSHYFDASACPPPSAAARTPRPRVLRHRVVLTDGDVRRLVACERREQDGSMHVRIVAVGASHLRQSRAVVSLVIRCAANSSGSTHTYTPSKGVAVVGVVATSRAHVAEGA